MARIDEKTMERMRTLTVEVLLDLRAAYLGTSGANPLKHWDQLQDRMRAAARTTTSPEEWATSVARNLQLPAMSVNSCRSLKALVDEVTERSCRREFLDLVEKEYGYIIALARLCAEQRKSLKVTKDGEVLP